MSSSASSPSSSPLACIILAAGQGKRMQSALPKPLHKIAGVPMVSILMERVRALGAERIVLVTGADQTHWQDYKAGATLAVQDPPRGTGDAVRAGLAALEGFEGDILILLADMPLLSAVSLQNLRAARGQGLSVLGAQLDQPFGFGRLVCDTGGHLSRIVEERDASDEERAITLCNMGAFCGDARDLRKFVARIGNDNAQGEYYITDLPAIAAAEGVRTSVHIVEDAFEIRGANSRAELAVMEGVVQDRLRLRAMENGATLIDPASVYFSWDTRIGRDVVVEPGVFFGPGVVIADRVTIRAWSHLEGAHIATGAVIGPFARLRPGSDIGEDCRIGNFVEVKAARLARGVKAGHLAYIGDADVGADVNFSCGAITANYDGFKKSKTVIGDGAMIGSNVNLVAPVTIGAGAYIAAGSTITKDVEENALAVAREKPSIIAGWAARRRAKKS